MAIVSPALLSYVRGQDATTTVTLTPAQDASSWTVEAILRAYNGGPALATKTIGSGITGANLATAPVWTITWSASDLTQVPGGYIWEFNRTNAGFGFPIVESSGFTIRPAAGSNYPRLTNLAEYVIHAMAGATLTDNLANATMMQLAAAEDFIKRLCQRDFTYKASGIEYYDGTGTNDLLLRRTPVHSVASIYEDLNGYAGQGTDPFAAATLLTAGTDYYLPLDSLYGDGLNYAGIVKRIGRTWPVLYRRPHEGLSYFREPYPGCLKVTYTAGFDLIPYDIKLAVWDLATMIRKSATTGMLPMSQSGEGYSRSYGSISEDAKRINSVQNILTMYRRIAIV